MEYRWGRVLGNRIIAQDASRGSYPPCLGAYKLGFSQSARTQKLRGLPPSGRFTTPQLAPGSSQVQVWNIGFAPFPCKIKRFRGVCGYVIGLLCSRNWCSLLVVYVLLSCRVILCLHSLTIWFKLVPVDIHEIHAISCKVFKSALV